MNVVLLLTPGRDWSAGLYEFKRLGYTVYPFESTKDTSVLTDTEEQNVIRNYGAFGEHRSLVRPLRASWIKMLTDPTWSTADDVIFCEADAYPYVSADKLREWLSQLPDDADFARLCKLFSGRNTLASKVYSEEGKPVNWIDYYHTSCEGTWGTHALWVSKSKRSELATLFSQYRCPVDEALLLINKQGKLKGYRASANLFDQVTDNTINKASWYEWYDRQFRLGYLTITPDNIVQEEAVYKGPKCALLISSCGRPSELIRQVHSMLAQTYRNKHIFVAAKGYTEDAYNRFLLPQFERYIKQGLLTVRQFDNKNQMSNLIDTVRGLDIDSYNYFFKIDDDDFYDYRYVATIMEAAEFANPSTSFYWEGDPTVFKKVGRSFSIVPYGWYGRAGNSCVFSAKAFRRLLQEEEDKDILVEDLKSWSAYDGTTEIGWHEDRFYHHVMSLYGAEDVAYLFNSKGIPLPFFVGYHMSAYSVCRGGVSSAFINKSKDVTSKVTEKYIEIEGEGVYYLMGGRIEREGAHGCGGTILDRFEDSYLIHWDDGKESKLVYDVNNYKWSKT